MFFHEVTRSVIFISTDYTRFKSFDSYSFRSQDDAVLLIQ